MSEEECEDCLPEGKCVRHSKLATMTAADPLEALRNLREYLANQPGTQPVVWLDGAIAAWEKERAEFSRAIASWRKEEDYWRDTYGPQLAALRAEVLKVAEEIERGEWSIERGGDDRTPLQCRRVWVKMLRKACE